MSSSARIHSFLFNQIEPNFNETQRNETASKEPEKISVWSKRVHAECADEKFCNGFKIL
jgi:hypothetical protein